MNEIQKLLEAEVSRRDLLTCLSIDHTNAKYDQLETLIVDYQKEYCGFEPAASSKCTTTQVSGQVTTSDGAPLPGVTITVKGATIGTITDMFLVGQ